MDRTPELNCVDQTIHVLGDLRGRLTFRRGNGNVVGQPLAQTTATIIFQHSADGSVTIPLNANHLVQVFTAQTVLLDEVTLLHVCGRRRRVDVERRHPIPLYGQTILGLDNVLAVLALNPLHRLLLTHHRAFEHCRGESSDIVDESVQRLQEAALH